MSRNKNFLFVNNIFIGIGFGRPWAFIGRTIYRIICGGQAGGNIFFRNYSDIPEWSAATGQEKLNGQIAGRQIDPNLKGPFITTITDPYQLHSLTGYTLMPGSPVKNYTLDLASLHIPAQPHMIFLTALSFNEAIPDFSR